MSHICHSVTDDKQEALQIGIAGALQERRKTYMAALALADVADLEDLAASIDVEFAYSFLRRPEAGLIMVEGRAGNSGQRFNVGEMLVTRCVVRLEGQGERVTEGYAFIKGNAPRHAELAAMFDALLQRAQQADLGAYALANSLEHRILIRLNSKRDGTMRVESAKTAATKVDFFTLVRGEDE